MTKSSWFKNTADEHPQTQSKLHVAPRISMLSNMMYIYIYRGVISTWAAVFHPQTQKHTERGRRVQWKALGRYDRFRRKGHGSKEIAS